MPLTASCDGIYFTDPPRDNVITLTWENDSTQHTASYAFLIFKVKSTAPCMFHMHPCFGAIPLSESYAASTPTQTFHNKNNKNQEAKIVIGLRESHILDKHNGYHDKIGAREKTSHSNTKNRYQERFVIESLIVSQDMLGFQQVVDSLHDSAKLSRVVKGLWSLISSKEIPRTHTQPCNSINLKVYMRNVIMYDDDALKSCNESMIAVVVPRSSVVVPPSFIRLSKSRASASSNNYATDLRNRAEGIQGGNSSSLVPVKDELRALKNEVAMLRKMKAHDASGSTSSVNRGSSSEPKHTPALNGNGDLKTSPTESFLRLGNNTDDETTISSDEGGNKTLKLTSLPGFDEHSGATKNDGLKFYILLGSMFLVYFLGLFIQRSLGAP